MGLFDKLFGKKDNIGKKEQADKEKESIEKNESKISEVGVKEENQKVNISQRLTKSKEGFFSKLKNIFTSKSKVDDSIYEELEDLLLQSDVGLNMTTNLINQLEKEVKSNKIDNTEEVYEVLKKLMSEFLLSQDSKIYLKDNVSGEVIKNKANVLEGNNKFETNETTNTSFFGFVEVGFVVSFVSNLLFPSNTSALFSCPHRAVR